MHLNPEEQQRANKKREIILAHFPEGLKKCNQCGGTGLDCISSFDGDFSWDSSSYCDKCKGLGFIEWKETILEKLCTYCDGGGRDNNFKKCEYCEGKGVLDWIRYMRVGRKK